MKLCFTINPTRKKEEIASYKKVLDLGLYQALEIFYPYDQGVSQLKEYTAAIKEIKDEYPDLELVLHLPHGPYNGICNKTHLDTGSLEIMMAASRYAASFGVKKLTTHLGHLDKSLDRKMYITNAVESVQKLCDYVLPFGQYVMIENMPGDSELGYSPDELLEIITKVNRNNVKFILDTGHMHTTPYEEKEFITKLGKYLYHIHTHDNDGTADQHRPFHQGNINFNEHFTLLKSINYKELHCLEIIYHSVDDLINNSKLALEYKDLL